MRNKKISRKLAAGLLAAAFAFQCGAGNILQAAGNTGNALEADGTEADAADTAAEAIPDLKDPDTEEPDTDAAEGPLEVQETYLIGRDGDSGSCIDALTGSYLMENVDALYTAAEKAELANVVLVKLTLVDRDLMEEGETLDDMFASEDYALKHIVTFTTYAAVYNLSDESSYYAAYVDTMHGDEDASVTDWCFAANSDYGETLGNCIYDGETGIAYLAKENFLAEDGTAVAANMQVQLMEEVPLDGLASSVAVVMDDGEEAVAAVTEPAGIFEDSITVQAEAGMEEDALTVAVNGIPVDAWEYESESGELSISASPALVQTIAVNAGEGEEKEGTDNSGTEAGETGDGSLLSRISSAVSSLLEAAALAYADSSIPVSAAMTAASMDELATVELPSWVKTGTVLTGTAPYAYNGNGTTAGYSHTTYAYSPFDNTAVHTLAKLVYSGGTLDWSKVSPASTALYHRFCFYMQTGDYTKSGADLYASWTYNNAGATTAQMKALMEQFGGTTVRLLCGHSSTPVSSSWTNTTRGENGKYELNEAAVRFLEVNRTKGYAVIGVTTRATHSQEGAGIFKVALAEEDTDWGYLTISKKSGNTAVSSKFKNGVYDLSGTQYYIYTDKACTKRYRYLNSEGLSVLPVITTDSSGKGSKIRVEAGTYYLKEAQSNKSGYLVDTAVYGPVTVTAANTVNKAASAGTSTDVPWSWGISLQKTSNSSYSMSGCTYTLYYGVAVEGDDGGDYTSGYQGFSGSFTNAALKAGWSAKKKQADYTTGSTGKLSASGLAMTGLLYGTDDQYVYYLTETAGNAYYGVDSTIWAFVAMEYLKDSKYAGSSVYYPATGYGVRMMAYKSTDGGNTWTRTSSGDYDISLSAQYGGTTELKTKTLSVTSTEPLKTFSFSLRKFSGNTAVSSAAGYDTAGYSLAGAVYTLYKGDIASGALAGWTDAQKHPVSAYTTAGTTGTFTAGSLSLNTSSDAYYLKETSPSPGYGLDPTVWYIHVWNSGGTDIYTLSKSLDNGKTWTVLESRAALGSSRSLTVGGAGYLSASEPPEYWRYELQKESGDPEMTEGNGCYSLAGAEYTLYTADLSYGSIAAAWKAATAKSVETTDENGGITSIQLPVNTSTTAFFLRETKASPGYGLAPTIWYIHIWQSSGSTTDSAGNKIPAGTLVCTMARSLDEGMTWETTAYREAMPEDRTISITSEEPALNDPFALQLQKHDADTQGTEAQGTASLEGALFLVSYWDNTEGDTTGEPYRTWVFRTDEDGYLSCRYASYLVTESVTVDGITYTSDELYYNPKVANLIEYPLGTYNIKEIQAPLYYQLEGTMKLPAIDDEGMNVATGLTGVIMDGDQGIGFYYRDNRAYEFIDADNLIIDIYEEVHKGSVTIRKYDSNGSTPLEGVEFTLTGDDGTVCVEKTNAEGEILFDELTPQHYILAETSALDGYALLAEPVDVTIPMELTEEEAKEAGADVSQAVWDPNANGGQGAYCFYDLAYEVTDAVSFDMPAAGGGPGWLYAGMIFGCLIISAGMLSLLKMRRKEGR